MDLQVYVVTMLAWTSPLSGFTFITWSFDTVITVVLVKIVFHLILMVTSDQFQTAFRSLFISF